MNCTKNLRNVSSYIPLAMFIENASVIFPLTVLALKLFVFNLSHFRVHSQNILCLVKYKILVMSCLRCTVYLLE